MKGRTEKSEHRLKHLTTEKTLAILFLPYFQPVIFIYALVALWIAWVWVDYFRLIDIYEREHLRYALFIFVLGGASVFLVFGLDFLLLRHLSFELNGQAVNDFLYYTLQVGAVEELAKILPFVIFYFLFGKQLNEPIDYLFYGCTSALGFAAVENALYFDKFGAHIISSRAILSTVGHMMWTGIICYGIIRYKFLHMRRDLLAIGGYFALAALGHGFFNFWLAYAPFQGNGYLVTLAYFLVSISLFAGMLNNAINNSAFFTYHHVIHSSHVARRLFIHLGIVFLAQFAVLFFTTDAAEAVYNLRSQIIFPGLIVMIVIFRLSRFTLIKNSWEPLPLEFPFEFYKRGKEGRTFLGVRGNAFDDVLAMGYFEKPFRLHPLSAKGSHFKKPYTVQLTSKHFLSEDEPAYQARLQTDGSPAPFDPVLLVAKSSGSTFRGAYPIVGIYQILNPITADEARQPDEKFRFLEWGYVVRDGPSE